MFRIFFLIACLVWASLLMISWSGPADSETAVPAPAIEAPRS